MNFDKALALYRNDKTLQILRAEHFPLLISFFHLAFKQQERIAYPQPDLVSLLGDFLFSLERQGIPEYNKPPIDYLQKWAQQGYLRRYYESTDEPIYELSPASENALKWLEDLNKQQFVGTHSRNHSASIDDLDMGVIREFLQTIKSDLFAQSTSMPFEDLCRQMRIVAGTNEYVKPINAGLLFFNKQPHEFFRGATTEGR